MDNVAGTDMGEPNDADAGASTDTSHSDGTSGSSSASLPQEGGKPKPKARVVFEAGDSVRVTDGPFANFSATVEEVKADKQKVKVSLSMFGRATSVELDFAQVEKA